jgi:hypothetical protein
VLLVTAHRPAAHIAQRDRKPMSHSCSVSCERVALLQLPKRNTEL